MALRDPIAVYIAANNLEAHMLCNVLLDSGIEAAVIEDVSRVGTWIGGLASQLHRPKIWVEREDAELAMPVINDFESRASERRAADRATISSQSESIAAKCEECGAESTFPVAQYGSVQNCPVCSEYMDVGQGREIEGWNRADESPDEVEVIDD